MQLLPLNRISKFFVESVLFFSSSFFNNINKPLSFATKTYIIFLITWFSLSIGFRLYPPIYYLIFIYNYLNTLCERSFSKNRKPKSLLWVLNNVLHYKISYLFDYSLVLVLVMYLFFWFSTVFFNYNYSKLYG